MKEFLRKMEENSVLTNIMIYSGFLTVLAVLSNAGPWTLVAAGICAVAFAADMILCSMRVSRELAFEDQAARELVSGVYRIAKDHHITQDGRRVIVYHTEEEL